MPSPFPGMDPYIERPERWPDVHDSLITHIRGVLQPLLKPRYVAVGQERVYVEESDRFVRPGVGIIRTGSEVRAGGVATVVQAPDTPLVFEIDEDEAGESFLQIVDPKNPSHVITAIEVLSPKNKRLGPGRKSYIQKRSELRRGGANVVEIDLLRDGRPIAWIARSSEKKMPPFHYSVAVTRQRPPRREVYTATVRQRLPRVAIPLKEDDTDVTLDLQAAFTRCWDEGPYPELLDYAGPPPGRMSDEDAAWCVNLLREKQLRV